MRTTLDIDSELLMAAKELAKREKKTAGQMVSELLRRALTAPAEGIQETPATYGFQAFGPRGGVVTNQHIDQLREDTGD